MNAAHVAVEEISFRRDYRVFGLLLALIAASHGVLLLCDYQIWDGHLIESWQRTGNFAPMLRHYSEAGITHHFAIHRTVGIFENRVWLYKLISLVTYWGIGCGVYRLAHSSGLLRREAALLLSAFVVTCPGLMTLGEAALLPYVLGTLITMLAACVAIHAESQTRGRHATWRGLAIVLFFFGLTYYAMVVFYLAFYLLLLWHLWARLERKTWRSFGWLIVRRMDYLLVPPVFWKVRMWLMPTHGHYVGYNTPKLDLQRLLDSYATLFTLYIPEHFAELAINPLVLLAVVVAGVVLARRFPFWKPASWRVVGMLAGVGVFLVLLGCFPYASVPNKIFGASGYDSNASELIPFGGSFVLVAFLGAVRCALRKDRDGILAMTLFLYLLVSFSGIWSSNYLHWQACTAREESVSVKLRRDPLAQKTSIFIIGDQEPVPRTYFKYPPSVYTVLIHETFGDRTRFALPFDWPRGPVFPHPLPEWRLSELLTETTLPYYFTEVQLGGRQSYVLVTRGRDLSSPVEIACRDLWWRCTGRRGTPEYAGFLEGLSDVTVIPAR